MLSVYCVFYNERDWLPASLASWLPFADEVVLIDNGSNDGIDHDALRGLAAEAGVPLRLEVREERGYNLGELNTQALCLCSEPWAIRMDADEYLYGDPEILGESLSRNSKESAILSIPLYFEGSSSGFRLRCVCGKGWFWRYWIDDEICISDVKPMVFKVPENILAIHHRRASNRDGSLRYRREVLARLPWETMTSEEILFYANNIIGHFKE